MRPPRLGGAERVGVFATRSPFRPNPIGLPASSSIVSSSPMMAPSFMCWGRPARRHAHLRH
ncbi:MAG: TrmO family methyltransferase [Collinsella sp.]